MAARESTEHTRGMMRCRPCPFTSCRHHLYLDVRALGAIVLNRPELQVDELKESCALDVADRGGVTLEEVGGLLSMARERVRQIEEQAIAKLQPKLMRR
jgi:hypothetical protein